MKILELAKPSKPLWVILWEAYRERKRLENAFEFADISHYTIEIF